MTPRARPRRSSSRSRGPGPDEEAARIARNIANSILIKCSWYGKDPYWGRIAAEAGASADWFSPDTLTISYGDQVVFRNGAPGDPDPEELLKVMEQRHLHLTVDLGQGNGTGRVLTTDITHAYIDENMGTSLMSTTDAAPGAGAAGSPRSRPRRDRATARSGRRRPAPGSGLFARAPDRGPARGPALHPAVPGRGDRGQAGRQRHRRRRGDADVRPGHRPAPLGRPATGRGPRRRPPDRRVARPVGQDLGVRRRPPGDRRGDPRRGPDGAGRQGRPQHRGPHQRPRRLRRRHVR